MTTAARTDRPGYVIPILEREFDDFETEATSFLNGQKEERLFIGFRLKQGVYGQRQPGRQMIRIKLPFGGVTPEQLDVLADVVERYAPLNKAHITTRQNFQIHHVPLPDMFHVLRRVGEVGLSSREACGSVVRNVTGDPWAGIRDDEPFDITPYAGAFVRYWVRNEITQLLPRKFKVTFSGSDLDEGIVDIHDLGFIPRVRVIDGKEVRGFKMVTGGGLAIFARKALVVSEFVPVDEYLKVSEAVLRIFNAATELRKNLAKARLKFLVQRVGETAFQEMVAEELKKDWAQADPETFKPDRLLFLDDEEADTPKAPANLPTPGADRAEFEEWARTAVRKQRQPGFVAVQLRIPQGDIEPHEFRGLAAIMRRYGNGRARTTQWQNLVLRWIPEGAVYGLWREVRELGFGDSGIQEIRDVVSCPGTDSCKLGITSSMGLNRALGERIASMEITDPLTRRMLINVSGCPNSCGQHHLGNIGFHGAAIKSGERQVPAYHIFIGGSRRDGASLRIGTLLKSRIPAKRAPDAFERFVRMYERDRTAGEEFNTFADRVGTQPFEDAIKDLTLPPEFSLEAMDSFIDWEREGLYVLERGEGECAI
ncbi:MAG: nitrite/sulfite reductase [Dehalococcoidia bacterium]